MAVSGSPSDHLVNLMGVFLGVWADRLREGLENVVGSTGSAPAALLAVDTWPDRSVDFLASVLGLTHSGTVRLVDRLSSEGWVERLAGVDGRTAALRLTRSGRALAGRARAERRRLLGGLLAQLDQAEQAGLGVAMARILRGDPRTRPEARRTCRLCDHSVCEGPACPVSMSVGRE
jgi:MarR family transcriptional repressor of emrRAB